MKQNLAKRGKGLAYCLSELTHDEAQIALSKMDNLTDEERDLLRGQLFRVRWLGHVSMTADDALAQPNRKQRSDDIGRAAEWLRQYLADGPKPSEGIPADGNAALNMKHRLDWWRDKVLKERLGGKPRKEGIRDTQVWFWELSQQSQDSQRSQRSQRSQVLKGPWSDTEGEVPEEILTPENVENVENVEER